MSGRGNKDREPEHPLLRHPGVIAGLLALAAAVIGLMAALINANSGEGESVVVTSPPAIQDGSGGSEENNPPSAEDEPDDQQTPQGEAEVEVEPDLEAEAEPEPPRDGNSRTRANHLVADKVLYTSLEAGNDVDWWVYRAPEAQTATIEITKDEGNEEFGSILITYFEGDQEIDDQALTAEEPPLVVSRSVSAGSRLFIEVIDHCGDANPCGIGPYSIVVRTAPAG